VWRCRSTVVSSRTETGRIFFFEKKKQKLLLIRTSAHALKLVRRPKQVKVFCFFFQKRTLPS